MYLFSALSAACLAMCKYSIFEADRQDWMPRRVMYYFFAFVELVLAIVLIVGPLSTGHK
jgi:hypothetical protein